MVLVVFFLVVFVRRIQKPILKTQDQHRLRQLQHMERVEQLLERIAKAAESKDTKAP
jgi:hypothetical protein